METEVEPLSAVFAVSLKNTAKIEWRLNINKDVTQRTVFNPEHDQLSDDRIIPNQEPLGQGEFL